MKNAVRPKANGFPMRIGLVDLMVDIDWYELKEVRGDTMHFCIYNEWTLDNEVDAVFVDENGLGISQDEFRFNYISCYDGHVIHLTLVSADRNYTLRKVETY